MTLPHVAPARPMHLHLIPRFGKGAAEQTILEATRVGSLPELLHDGRNGLLVPPESQAALTGAVSRLLENESLRMEMGCSALATPNTSSD